MGISQARRSDDCADWLVLEVRLEGGSGEEVDAIR